MTQSEKKGRSILTNLLIVLIGQVGCLTLVIVLASVFGGLWLDKMCNTKPVFTLAMLFAGIPVSVLSDVERGTQDAGAHEGRPGKRI